MSELNAIVYKNRKKTQKASNDTENVIGNPQRLPSKNDELRDDIGACRVCLCKQYRGRKGGSHWCEECGHNYDSHGAIIKDNMNGQYEE